MVFFWDQYQEGGVKTFFNLTFDASVLHHLEEIRSNEIEKESEELCRPAVGSWTSFFFEVDQYIFELRKGDRLAEIGSFRNRY